MIWLFFLGLALVLGFALWRTGGFDKAGLQLIAAAMLVAAAGYVWQGRPNLSGRPADATEAPRGEETAFSALRPEFFERFDTASRWLIIADSYQRRGNSADAVGIIRSGLRAHPDNVALWVGLGEALAAHGGGLNPAAELAYRRADAIAPEHPAPRFFYGLSLIRSGRVEEGELVWRQLLARAPANAKWRPAIADRLQIIEQMKAMPPRRP